MPPEEPHCLLCDIYPAVFEVVIGPVPPDELHHLEPYAIHSKEEYSNVIR